MKVRHIRQSRNPAAGRREKPCRDDPMLAKRTADGCRKEGEGEFATEIESECRGRAATELKLTAPSLEKIMFDMKIVKNFPYRVIDEIVNRLGLMIEGGNGRQEMRSHFSSHSHQS